MPLATLYGLVFMATVNASDPASNAKFMYGILAEAHDRFIGSVHHVGSVTSVEKQTARLNFAA
jgi:hypothetical protein